MGLSYLAKASWRKRWKQNLALVILLSLGIGTVVASLLATGYLIPKEDYQLQKDLYYVGANDNGNNFTAFIWAPYFEKCREHTELFAAVGQGEYRIQNISKSDEPLGGSVLYVNRDFFSVLNVQPQKGRLFALEEFNEGRNNVVVVTDSFWRKNCSGCQLEDRPFVRVGRERCIIVGVLKREQHFPDYVDTQVIRPEVFKWKADMPWTPTVFAIARLREGVTAANAEQVLNMDAVPIVAAFKQFAEMFHKRTVLKPLSVAHNDLLPKMSRCVLAAALLLFVVALGNAANLLLLQVEERKGEFFIRVAVGATERQIWSHIVADLFCLFIFTLPSAFYAGFIITPLLSMFAEGEPSFNPMQGASFLNAATIPTIVFSVICYVLLLVVVLTYRRTRRYKADTAKGEILSYKRNSWYGIGTAAVALQLGISFALISTGISVFRYANSLKSIDLGFNADGLIKIPIEDPLGQNFTGVERRARISRLVFALERCKGVTGCSFGTDSLLKGFEPPGSLEVRLSTGAVSSVTLESYSSEFQKLTGIRLERGRWPEKGLRGECLVNEEFVKRYLVSRDPIGEVVRSVLPIRDMVSDFRIVGVVHNIRTFALSVPAPRIYCDFETASTSIEAIWVRTQSGKERELYGEIGRTIYKTNSDVVVKGVRSMREVVNESLIYENFLSRAFLFLGIFAVIVTCLGVFVFNIFVLNRRLREIALRSALGATLTDLLWMDVKVAMRQIGLGMIIGILPAIWLTQLLGSYVTRFPSFSYMNGAEAALIAVTTSVVAHISGMMRFRKLKIAELIKCQ